ncbi:MAG TPA: tetratricopeptide repeat protein [Candidatus Methylomirabilis sp.]|nr:tetratricopeptide repeat protein [Candidatus Methylomirabilis sp.]
MDIRANVCMKRQRFIKIGIFALAVLAIDVVLFLLLGRPGMKSDVKSQFDKAEAAYKSGNFPDAEAAYLKAKELEPKNAQILSCLGDLSLLNNRPGEAIRYYNDALDNTPWYLNIWPLNVQLKKQLGMAYYRQDIFTEASRYFREAAGPINAGPFKILRSLSECTGIFASNATYMIEGPERDHQLKVLLSLSSYS